MTDAQYLASKRLTVSRDFLRSTSEAVDERSVSREENDSKSSSESSDSADDEIEDEKEEMDRAKEKIKENRIKSNSLYVPDIADSGRLFLRNLSYHCTEENLREAFEPYFISLFGS